AGLEPEVVDAAHLAARESEASLRRCGDPGRLHHVEERKIERGVREIEPEIEVRRALALRRQACLEADGPIEPRREIEAQGTSSIGVEPPLQVDCTLASRRAAHGLS